ncbi:hypothetical protein [Ensifer canadensis]
MVGIPKTLEDMSMRERCCMLETVAGALDAVAEEAEDLGDARFAANSKCVACTIRGYADRPRNAGSQICRASSRAGDYARASVLDEINCCRGCCDDPHTGSLPLEDFQEKREAVFRPEMGKTMALERFAETLWPSWQCRHWHRRIGERH